jgi:protein-tyrosine phosphatase
MKILFVCSGNICRSPMAAEYFRKRAAWSGLSHVVVDSAGTLGIEGSPASPEAIAVMHEIDVDLSGHRSKGLSEGILRTTDLTVAMTRDHLDFLARSYPEGNDRRLLLRAFEDGPQPSPDGLDLDDPMGKSVEIYRQQLPVIVRCVDHLVLHLRHADS